MATVQLPQSKSDRESFNKRLSAVAWGLLFVWVGVAVLFQVGWGWGLVVVGGIILGAQVVHVAYGCLRLEMFTVVCGLLFLLGGIWELFSIQVGLVPVLLIAAGVVLMLSALTRRPAQ